VTAALESVGLLVAEQQQSGDWMALGCPARVWRAVGHIPRGLGCEKRSPAKRRTSLFILLSPTRPIVSYNDETMRPASQIVGRQFYTHTISQQDADVVFAHFAG
jgi:hypothetical protein